VFESNSLHFFHAFLFGAVCSVSFTLKHKKIYIASTSRRVAILLFLRLFELLGHALDHFRGTASGFLAAAAAR
jgi:hypothetical protein